MSTLDTVQQRLDRLEQQRTKLIAKIEEQKKKVGRRQLVFRHTTREEDGHIHAYLYRSPTETQKAVTTFLFSSNAESADLVRRIAENLEAKKHQVYAALWDFYGGVAPGDVDE